jgi:hypothetical protein
MPDLRESVTVEGADLDRKLRDFERQLRDMGFQV